MNNKKKEILIGPLQIEILKAIGIRTIKAFPARLTIEQALEKDSLSSSRPKMRNLVTLQEESFKALVEEDGTVKIKLEDGWDFIEERVLDPKNWRPLAEMLSAEETPAD